MASEVIPFWLEKAGQALVYWMGYQHQRYRHYLLPEGAIVAELAALINAEISTEQIVHREIMYKNIAKRGRWMREIRADLAVTGTTAFLHDYPRIIIELKRADNIDEINLDLIRLAYFKQDNPDSRTFMVIASQNHRPDKWVLHSGEVERGEHKIELKDKNKKVIVNYVARRSLKAASSFRSRDFAHYCVILEVL